MKINRAYRYELKPNVAQRILLAQHAGTARFAYNWGLARRITLYEAEKKSTNAIAQHRELNQLKQTEFPWMYEVSKCAPQEALRDLDKAFKNFFRGLKLGQKVGFPRFKKKGQDDSFRLTGAIKVNGKAVQLPRLGVIRLKEEPWIRGRILSATVSREADRWFVSLACEVEIPDPAPVLGPIVGIDVGLNHFAVLSDGTKVEAPKPLDKFLKRLRRLSKKHSRKQKGSTNRKKSALALARLHRRIRNIRQDFLHKLTTNLAKTKSEIVMEDLNVRGMMRNGSLARHIADVGWGEFRRQLGYKTAWYGSKLTLVHRFYPSSKTCSACGYVREELPLSVREWDCPSCGVHHDRDHNAAKNLKNYAKGIA
ncbi:transposase, is605 family, orfb [Heliomicrobium modesticaldum Ice1]|uniref:Transposase, is605 family, orfb n=1 Tax=Heliobacterium modesticaldum (strain ATCC 51547 / Ice1) TaxID=498761 RepID=B0TDN7_HELMI|nr:RNA-guided endonuclease TnpB family protein [Heliomicrobium modesticaldum]ABZ85562.1 transposase, is605 family, orfb [Heliomicrobium modesticaldum Ice1]